MDSKELQNLREAYHSVYEATGREEMIAANIARAKAARTSSTAPKTTTTAPKPTTKTTIPTTTTAPKPAPKTTTTPKPSGGLLGSLDTVARDTAGRVGEVIGREKAKSVPGANLPILGDVIRNEGGRRGRNQGQQMYDKAKETIGGLLKQDYEPDLFDVILEYLVAEGYADTNENALVIMANMSEEWKQSIVEAPGEWFGGLRDKARASREAQMQSSKPTPKPGPNVSSPFAKPASRDDSGKLTTYGAGGGAAAERAGKTRQQVMKQGAKNLETKNKSNPGPNFGR